MFNVGGGELLVILLLGLLILGPERLPKAMGEVGRYVAQLRRLSSGFQDEIRRAMDPDDVPFRPGEERLRPNNVDEEVRVVGADGPDDDPSLGDHDDGIIDTSAVEHDPSHAPLDDEEDDAPSPAVPSAEEAPTGQGASAPDDDRVDRPEGEDPTGNVTPMHGRRDDGTRAAG